MNSDNKIISLEEALSFIKSGDHVVTGLGAGEAKLFLENLHTIADRVNNVTITNSLSMLQPQFYEAQYKNSFNIDSIVKELINCYKAKENKRTKYRYNADASLYVYA